MPIVCPLSVCGNKEHKERRRPRKCFIDDCDAITKTAAREWLLAIIAQDNKPPEQVVEPAEVLTVESLCAAYPIYVAA